MNRLIMMGKPIINKSLNWSNIGYVLKDGTIQFASEEAVFNFAKNAVQRGLKSKIPYERNVFWKNRRVLAISDGNKYRVKISKDLPEDVSSMHGHVTESPLSTQDYIAMMCNNHKEEIAMCPSGNYSKFTRIEDSNTISTQRKIAKIYKKGIRHERLEAFKGVCNTLRFIATLIFKKIRGVEINESEFLNFRKKMTARATKNGVHFWEELSGEKMGAIFESNLKY